MAENGAEEKGQTKQEGDKLNQVELKERKQKKGKAEWKEKGCSKY